MNWLARSITIIVAGITLSSLLFCGVSSQGSPLLQDAETDCLCCAGCGEPAETAVCSQSVLPVLNQGDPSGTQEDPKKKDDEDPKGKKGGDKGKGALKRLKRPGKNQQDPENQGKKGASIKPAVSAKVQQGPQKEEGAEGANKPAMRVSRSGQRRENPTVVEDITVYRKKPLDFITGLDSRQVIDLEGVDFDADVIATINGLVISRDEFRLNVIDSSGALEVDRSLTAILTDLGREKLIAKGADPTEFEVPDELIETEIKNQILLTKQQDRSGQFSEEGYREMIDMSIGWEKFRDIQRSNLAFGKVYLPTIQPREPKPVEEGESNQISTPVKEATEAVEAVEAEGAKEKAKVVLDPNLPIGKNFQDEEVNIYMPMITWNILDGSDTDRSIRDSLNQAYQEGRALGSFIRPNYVNTIKEALIADTEIVYHTSGTLPEGVYMTVGDRKVTLDDIYPMLIPRLEEGDLKQVLNEMLVYKAMDKPLQQNGFALSDEEFEAAFNKHEKEFEGTLFPLRFIMSLHGYYMKEDYKKMYRRRLGFEKMLQAQGQMNEEVLKEFFETGGRLFYQNGGVKVQEVFFGIFDHKTLKIRDNAWQWAKEQVDAVLKEIEEGADFLEAVKKYEDINGYHRPAELDYMTRNDFRNFLGERTKTILTEGYSLADDIFYNAKEGDIIGPITVTRGEFGNPVLKGIYLFKVVGYRTMLELNPFEKSRPTIETDYTDLTFNGWAGTMVAKADIKITKN